MLVSDELLAFRKFFELRAPDVKVELLSLDLQPTWSTYVEAMGMGFDQWDLNDGGLLKKVAGMMSGGTLDYVIIS
jgi:hypothetical protein